MRVSHATLPPTRRVLPPSRHIAFPNAPGYKNEGIYYEEVVTLAGFGRAYSIVYHPAADGVRNIEPAGESILDIVGEPFAAPSHQDQRAFAAGEPITGRVAIMGNADVVMMRCRPTKPQAEPIATPSATR
ncbi:MAG: hypothetical protein U0793_10065 [Gemmataceae bacterium]